MRKLLRIGHTKMATNDSKSQSEKFKQMAREVGADTDEKRSEERLRKVAKAKPDATQE